MVSALELYSGQSYDNQYLLTPLFTPDFGFYENLGIDTLVNHPQAMKVYMTHSPDTPWWHESMSGDNWYDLLASMVK